MVSALAFLEVPSNPEVIAALLKYGADAKAKDNDGKMAIDYAKDNEWLKGADALRELDARSN